MSMQESEDKPVRENKENPLTTPDPETKNTTDPQEHMEGPISSLMQTTEKSFESEDSGKKTNDDSKD